MLACAPKVIALNHENDALEPYIDEELPPAVVPAPDFAENEIALGWYHNEERNELRTARIAWEPQAGRPHAYLVGGSGTGKSKLLEAMILQDIALGRGFGVIDPTGDLVENVKGWLCNETWHDLEDDIVLLDPLRPESTVVFNPLDRIPGVSIEEQALHLVNAFKKIWEDAWGARMEDLLRNTLIVLQENDLTLAELPLFLIDGAFRSKALRNSKHPIAQDYFRRFLDLTDKTRNEWMESTLNKVDAFLADSRVRQALSGNRSSFDLRQIMDNSRVLLVRLDRGRLPESGDLLGSLLMAKIEMAAFSRSDTLRSHRVPFALYVDEFQNFASENFVETLAEARKYGLCLTMAHQNLAQMPRSLLASALGNCDLQLFFRVSRSDAEVLAKEALRVTGDRIKAVEPSGGGLTYRYYSLSEEFERCFQQLQDMPNRHFLAYWRRQLDTEFFHTDQLPDPADDLGMDQDEYEDYTSAVGQSYLVSRDELEQQAQQRRQRLGVKPSRDPDSFREPKRKRT